MGPIEGIGNKTLCFHFVIRKHIEKVEKRKAEEITLKVIHCTLIYICAILLNQFVNCLII